MLNKFHSASYDISKQLHEEMDNLRHLNMEVNTHYNS